MSSTKISAPSSSLGNNKKLKLRFSKFERVLEIIQSLKQVTVGHSEYCEIVDKTSQLG